MIISRTPYRISFFGGGTDYPAWFRENGGTVLATTIDKYCYIIARVLPPFFAHKYRLVYSRIELVNHVIEIKHPTVKAVLEWLNLPDGLEIQHYGDLPAWSGLGSSSAFTVGFLNSLYALNGQMSTKLTLANQAIFIEQECIKEFVGCQDQISSAFGGFNHIVFKQDGSFSVTPVVLPETRRKELEQHMMLFFSGLSRYSSDIAQKTVENLKNKQTEMHNVQRMVYSALDILQNTHISITEFGHLLHEAWCYKKSLSEHISTPLVDEAYEKARQAGALGGKLLGAGGGGFILLFVEPNKQEQVRRALKELIYVPVHFETMGSQIALYQPEGL